MENKEIKKSGLGRGLSSLFDPLEKQTTVASSQAHALSNSIPEKNMTRMIAISHLHPGAFQPRKHFDNGAIEALAQSIRTHGVLQPILVRKNSSQSQKTDQEIYEIVAGERRWRAACQVGLSEVPVLIQNFSDQEALRIALIENIQREDLTPIEEAEGYKRLIEEGGYTQEELASLIGKSRSHIANMLRLNNLPLNVKEMVEKGQLTTGHVRALLTTENVEDLAKHVLAKQLSVRETEHHIQKLKGKAENPSSQEKYRSKKTFGFGASPSKILTKDPEMEALEKHITDILGLKTSLQVSEAGAGTITLYFENYEELDGLFNKVTGLEKEVF